tara:strand:+ start:464 stop:607 length:144 start_codon:yes stop_codon:yes gene_type:complete
MKTIVSILFIIISSLFVYNLILILNKNKNKKCKTIYIVENNKYDELN